MTTEIGDFYRNQAMTAPPRRLAFDPAEPGFQFVDPEELFDGRALFSQIVVAPSGRTVAISGLIGCTAANELVSPDKGAQIAAAFANLKTAMAAVGLKAGQITRITEYVVDYQDADLKPIAAEIAALFPPGLRPSNVLVPVPRLGRPGAWFEIEAMGVLPDRGAA